MTNKMVPEVKELWLNALRSGEYAQTKGYLCRTEPLVNKETGDTVIPVGYCCLGVLVDLGVKAGVQEAGTPSRDHMGYEDRGYQSDMPEIVVLTTQVAKWAGLYGSGTLNKSVEGRSSLVGLNDDLGYTFEQIADVIEEQF